MKKNALVVDLVIRNAVFENVLISIKTNLNTVINAMNFLVQE